MPVIAIFLSLFLACGAHATKLIPITTGVSDELREIVITDEVIHLARSALADAGYDLQVRSIPFKRGLEMTRNGEIDFMLFDDKSDVEKSSGLISPKFPISYSKARVFYRADDKTFDEKHLEKFRGVITRSYSAISKEAQLRNLNVMDVATPAFSARMVCAKRADYFIAYQAMGTAIIANNPDFRTSLKMSNQVFLNVPIYFSFNKRFKKDMPRIEEALRKHLKGDLTVYPHVGPFLNHTPE